MISPRAGLCTGPFLYTGHSVPANSLMKGLRVKNDGRNLPHEHPGDRQAAGG